jgi:hypothetical protein
VPRTDANVGIGPLEDLQQCCRKCRSALVTKQFASTAASSCRGSLGRRALQDAINSGQQRVRLKPARVGLHAHGRSKMKVACAAKLPAERRPRRGAIEPPFRSAIDMPSSQRSTPQPVANKTKIAAITPQQPSIRDIASQMSNMRTCAAAGTRFDISSSVTFSRTAAIASRTSSMTDRITHVCSSLQSVQGR